MPPTRLKPISPEKILLDEVRELRDRLDVIIRDYESTRKVKRPRPRKKNILYDPRKDGSTKPERRDHANSNLDR